MRRTQFCMVAVMLGAGMALQVGSGAVWAADPETGMAGRRAADPPRRVVLVIDGTTGAVHSADWAAFVDDWRRSMAEEARAAALEFAFERPGQSMPRDPAALVTITVRNFHYLTQRRRSLLGVFAGEADLDVRAEIRDLPSGQLRSARHFVAPPTHSGVFGAATPRQVREVAHQILVAVRAH